ncbi:hypothetical protein SeMB42_g05713 [Synchytrium endobioticum]|uniref:EamA domain-containing protein n=1 Tax=Synchytrium endobioticum TaxID=286115 RepID=A0A507CPR9_9FUNG|nr:hypothetical protein SeMB42_g05713 [Synchytrium endobioticum]
MPHSQLELLPLSGVTSPFSGTSVARINPLASSRASTNNTSNTRQIQKVVVVTRANNNASVAKKYTALLPDGIDDIRQNTPADDNDQGNCCESSTDLSLLEHQGDLSDMNLKRDKPKWFLSSRKRSHQDEEASPYMSTISISPSVHQPATTLNTPTQKGFLQANLGLIYMLIASFFFSIMTFCVKILSGEGERIPLFEMVFIRSMGVLICSLILMAVQRMKGVLGPKECRRLLVFRGVSGFAGITVSWLAVQRLSLSDSTVLGFLAPIVTAVASYFILKEPYEVVDAIAGLFALVGVIFIARPTFVFGSLASEAPTVATPADGDFLPIDEKSR